jgi:hypothetical protein
VPLRRRGDRIETRFAAVHESASGTKRTFRDVCYLSAFGGKADISQRLADNRDFMITRPSSPHSLYSRRGGVYA